MTTNRTSKMDSNENAKVAIVCYWDEFTGGLDDILEYIEQFGASNLFYDVIARITPKEEPSETSESWEKVKKTFEFHRKFIFEMNNESYLLCLSWGKAEVAVFRIIW